MWSNFLLNLLIIGQITGFSLPEVLVSELYVLPSYTEKNELQVKVLPEIKNKVKPPRKITNEWGLGITTKAAAVADKETGQILWEKNSNEKLSLASITKLMTAMVYLEHQPKEGLEHIHTLVHEENNVEEHKLALEDYEKLRTFDLLRSSIAGSTNNTALALAHATEIPEDEFVKLMNEKARAIDMEDTTFSEPTGLDFANRGTISDVIKLARTAFDKPEIREPAGMKEHLMETTEKKTFRRITNTNDLLWDEDLKINAGKTGFIEEAGYNLVVEAEKDNHQIIVALLGASEDELRWQETKNLINWTFQNYVWN